jgi:hypothetical protein
VCSGGRCFDLKYTVTIIKKPAPFYLSNSGLALPSPEFVELPLELSKLIPEDAELPEGLMRAPVPYDTSSLTGLADAAHVIYLPVVQR